MKLTKTLLSPLLPGSLARDISSSYEKDKQEAVAAKDTEATKKLDTAKREAADQLKKELAKKEKEVQKRIEIIKHDVTEQVKKETAAEFETKIPELVKGEVEKAQALAQKEAFRYRLPWNINSNVNPDRKPESDIPFSFLRRMAQMYPIARACINRRIRQITQLDWDITTIDEHKEETGYESQIAYVKQFFKRPMGHKTRMREMLTLMTDDILTVDALCFEYIGTFGGELLYLIPVDPTTIALRVTETGGTPEPPDVAYEQYIRGQKVGAFTTDEMLYDSLNNKSYTPFGLAPLESLIMQAESALRGAMYNLAYFKESNVPEGFITLPEEIVKNKEQVQQWQDWFDMLIAGDPRMQHRLKILPGGSEYTPAKKPEDMAFERFELWLLQQTCAVFDVPPQDIGITYQVNKATADSQADLSRERGLYPLAKLFKEIFDDLIQENMGFTELQFSWNNLNPVDREEEANIADKEIRMGVRSIDEVRAQNGLQPLGVDHFIMTGSGPLFVKDLVAGKVGPVATLEQQNKQFDQKKQDNEENMPPNSPKKAPEKEETGKQALQELKAWRKAIYNDLKAGKALRTKFPCQYVDEETHTQIEEGLKGVHSKDQAKLLFDQFTVPDVIVATELMKIADKLRRVGEDEDE